MLRFLKDNAMGVSALMSLVLTVVFAFLQLSAAQTAALVGGPSVVANFLGNLVLRSNGKATT